MTVLTRKDVAKRVEVIKTWKRDDERAPHKPLLLLLALSRIVQGLPRLVPFEEIEEPLARLLDTFGPPRQSFHPEYPFWRLQRDGLWEVPGGEALKIRQGNTDPLKSELIKHHSVGGFPEAIFEVFCRDRGFLHEVVTTILDIHFPENRHTELRKDLGLSV
jgi:putative restriction endonuclease